MTYDPRLLGADCADCILAYEGRALRPVPTEDKDTARFAVVGEAPGGTEIEQGRPFCGASGFALRDQLKRLGLSRVDVCIANALACRPPDNDLGKLEAQLHARNRNRRAEGRLPHKHPAECCRPRLEREIERFDKVVALGGTAARVLTGSRAGILDQRGGPVLLRAVGSSPGGTRSGWTRIDPEDLEAGTFMGPGAPVLTGADARGLHTGFGTRPRASREPHASMEPRACGGAPTLRAVMPTLHPAFVLREARWKTALRTDFGRAMRLFQGRLSWRDPKMVFQPLPGALARFLGLERTPAGWHLVRPRLLAFDLETDGIEPLDCNVRTIQIGTASEVLVLGLLTCESEAARTARGLSPRSAFSLAAVQHLDGRFGPVPPRRFWPAPVEAGLREILAEWLSRAPTCGWNSGLYDSLVCEQWLKTVPAQHIDGILLHHLLEPELPHSLAYVGSILSDAPRWKSDDLKRGGLNVNDDRKLWVYGARDVAVTAIAIRKMLPMIQREGLGCVEGAA